MKEILKSATPTISVAILSILLTYFTTVKRERSQQVNKHRLEILQKLYTPIYRVIFTSVFPGGGYDGLDKWNAYSLVNIVEQNIELTDPILEELCWDLKEELYYSDERMLCFVDKDRRVLDHVVYNYNLLRKQLNLPYDYAYFSLNERFRIFQSNRKRRRDRVESLNAIRRQQREQERE
ncbi:hypothetical protein BEP19_07420 [Ammoniphilus oxalaticus]|uniref:Uncharacterized protein n=1 Tax=Ammoniphilus oxalaticus TaxID=66863 RepID=A0A419SJV9_9BACL|nr:hypothetical protein [Ammoniphilus oxalaticus]RKD24226.1 hypothetical protein BEP19_07420 [Ammoniphilus oxalaticus]